MNKKAKKSKARAVNSQLIRGPIQRKFYVFLLPTFLAFCIGFLYPFLQGIYLSFCKFTTTSDASFIGLSNYASAFRDAGFRHAFGFTALVTVACLVIINVFAFAVAFALTRGIRGSNIYRGVFFMPNLIGGIVLAYIWKMIFAAIMPKDIHLSTSLGYWALIIMLSWQQIGYMMIIYIAGLQAVSTDMLEAATIDGANGWQSLIHITIPSVMPSITICTFLTLTNGFKLFDQNMALNGGEPIIRMAGTKVKTTEMLALNIYNTFYGSSTTARGVGQAKAVLFFILVAVIALAQLRLTRDKEVQR